MIMLFRQASKLTTVVSRRAASSGSGAPCGWGWGWFAAGAGVSGAAAALCVSRWEGEHDERQRVTSISAEASASASTPFLRTLPVVDAQSPTLGQDLDAALSNMGFIVLTNHG